MIPLNIDSILEYLKSQNFDAKLQEATQQIYILFRIEDGEFPLFIRVDQHSNILQLFLFLPCSMRPKAPPEVARLLHLLNKEIDMPGFGLDETASVIFYRSVVLLPSNEIDGTLLSNVIASMVRLGPVFFPIILAVANGAYFEAVAPDARKILQQASIK